MVAAFAVIDPKNGNVEALVGGPKPGTDQFDDAVQGERQPGSGFKLFTLIAALEDGYNPNDSIFAASPCAVVFPGVPLQDGYNLNRLMNNDPGDPNGPVTLIQATALSINCAFLRLAHQVSLPKVIEVAKSMGLSDPTLNPSNPSLVIGTETVRPIEMAAAYATVADGGIYHAPTFVNRVVDRSGNLIYNGERPGRRVFSAQVAAEAVLALQATVQYGTGTAAALANVDVAGKTGTTENSVDAWFNGITPTLVSSVWIGDPNGELPMYVDGVEVYGADYPTEIWHDVMAYALSTTPYAAFPAPAPYLMPPLEYIDSPTLEEDDLISHGGIGPGDCVWNGTLVPCVTTTIPVPTTAGPTTTTSVPASTTATGSTPGTTTSSTFVPGAGGPGATTPGVPTPGSATPGALTPGPPAPPNLGHPGHQYVRHRCSAWLVLDQRVHGALRCFGGGQPPTGRLRPLRPFPLPVRLPPPLPPAARCLRLARDRARSKEAAQARGGANTRKWDHEHVGTRGSPGSAGPRHPPRPGAAQERPSARASRAGRP